MIIEGYKSDYLARFSKLRPLYRHTPFGGMPKNKEKTRNFDDFGKIPTFAGLHLGGDGLDPAT